MRKSFWLSLILLVSAVWAVAQAASGSSGAAPAINPDPNRVSIQGCLRGDVGELTLTDRTGTSYQLTGNTADMYRNVGHTVVVTGEKPSGAPLPGSMAAKEDTNTDTAPSVSVVSFADVSPSCGETP
jgi:hypothetical protein